MDREIQLISDGDGLVVTGDPAAVRGFLTLEDLWSSSKDLGQRLTPFLGAGAAVTQAASEIAANSRCWVKLTKESAQRIEKYGLRTNAKTGLSTGVLKGKKGQIKGFVEFAKGPGSPLNPAMLSGVAGIMAQTALQQSLAEITAYLAKIDAKVDDIRDKVDGSVQKDMIGAGLLIERAKTMREHEGRVTDDSWSEVQIASGQIANVQGYALLELKRIARKIGGQTKIGDLAETAGKSESEIREQFALLAHGLQLQAEFDLLLLDRALYMSPEELDARRRGLRADRQNRLELISQSTESFLACTDEAAHRANTKLLWHPIASPNVRQSRDNIAASVHDFHQLINIDSDYRPWEERGWLDAAVEAGGKVLEKADPALVTTVSTMITFTVVQARRKRG